MPFWVEELFPVSRTRTERFTTAPGVIAADEM